MSWSESFSGGEQTPMFSRSLSDHLDALIDELIMDGGVEAASLASILLAAKDSVKSDYLVTLSSRVWAANNELKSVSAADDTLVADVEPGTGVALGQG